MRLIAWGIFCDCKISATPMSTRAMYFKFEQFLEGVGFLSVPPSLVCIYFN